MVNSTLSLFRAVTLDILQQQQNHSNGTYLKTIIAVLWIDAQMYMLKLKYQLHDSFSIGITQLGKGTTDSSVS